MTKDILYRRTYRCLFDGASFDAWLMYTSARDRFQRTDELLDVPYYQPASDPEASIDYSRIEVKVCPSCLFASNDPAFFHSGNPYVRTIEPEEPVIRKVLETVGVRRQLAGQAQLQGPQRSVEDALASYRLGAQSSTVLYDADPRTYAAEIVRAANMALRAARISTDAGRPQDRHTWLWVAFGYLQRAKQASLKGMALYKSIYQLAVVGILLGENLITSRSYEEMRRLVDTDPSRELHAYFHRLRRVWEDRDRYREPPP